GPMCCSVQPTADGRLFLFTLACAGSAYFFSHSSRLNTVFLLPFLEAQRPGYEHVAQALRFCLSDLVKMKAVPARTCTARELGLFSRSPAPAVRISSPIPRGSTAWVRARRASLALLPQRPRQNESSTGVHVHRTRARPRPWRVQGGETIPGSRARARWSCIGP